MSWSEIKRAVNSTLGTGDFVPLDNIIKDGLYENFYETISIFADALDSEGNILVVPKGDTIADQKYSSDSCIRAIIPRGIKTIGFYAFGNCQYLRSITIPDTVTSIGGSAFSGCTALRTADIGNSITIISGNMFFNCLNLKSIAVPKGVTSIESMAFGQCSSLEEIALPAELANISNNAFHMCSDLSNVYYKGTEEQWSQIIIGSGNNDLLNATIHYNS